jgi:hypothetical protein
MSKEKYKQIIDQVYMEYLKHVITGVAWGLDKIEGYMNNCLVEYAGFYEHFSINPSYAYGFRPLTKEEFISKSKIDQYFPERWGLKIEERELSDGERITLAGFDYEDRGGIGYNMLKETVDMDNTIPRRLITLEYDGEKTEVYE